MRKDHYVQYRKRGSGTAYAFTKTLMTRDLARQVAAQYRKAGYDAIEVMTCT